MKKKYRVIAILPAYNAQKTIVQCVASLPMGVFNEIIVVDDASGDKTYETAKKIHGITLFRNSVNLGYGGNLKMCLGLALDHDADVIVELHPDGEYGTDGIEKAIEKAENGAYLILGNRFIKRPRGMYWQKIIATRLLTMLDNIFFGTHIPDMHQGFRVYTKKLLEEVDYRAFSNDYLFSFEIIVATRKNQLRIDWVPVTARYAGGKRGAGWRASVRYTFATFRVRIAYVFGLYKKEKLKKIHCPVCTCWYVTMYKFPLWYCANCRIGFTHPVARSMELLYPKEYWRPSGILGWVKEYVFRIAQQRRIFWIHSYMQKGNVLDVGSGGGNFGKQLGRHFTVTNIDPYFHGPEVLRNNFLTWKTTKKFDAIVFWESLEHVSDPVAYISRANILLKPNGFLFIEYPRYGCFESRVFGSRWYNLDIPRHLVHFTDYGIQQLIQHAGFVLKEHRGIFAAEYAPWGFAQSLFGWHSQTIGKLLIVSPFIIMGYIVEWMLHLAGQSPIGLVVAKKYLI